MNNCIWILLLFVAVWELYNTYDSQNPLILTDVRSVNLPVLFILSLYTYIIAYTYLPASPSLIATVRNMDVGIALILCHLSYEAYFTSKKTYNHDHL